MSGDLPAGVTGVLVLADGTVAPGVGHGRVGEAVGAKGVEVDLVVASQFEVFDASSAGEDVESDVEHVVGFVVGEMAFEEMEVAVDLRDEIDPLSQEKNGPDATGAESADAVSIFVVDVGRGHHGNKPLGSRLIVESLLDSPSALLEESLLACGAFFSESGAHSKAPLF